MNMENSTFKLLSVLGILCFHQLVNGDFLKLEEKLIFRFPQNVHSVSHRMILPPTSSTPLVVNNIPFEISMLIFQAHTQHKNITLAFGPPHSNESEFITGSNIGLVYLLDIYSVDAMVWLLNENKQKVTVGISVVPYDQNAPVPGGCNMEFPVQISPFLRIVYGRVNTKLEYQRASIGFGRGESAPSCESNQNFLNYDIYVYFLKEKDYAEEEYLNGIELMTNVSFIKDNAKKISPLNVTPVTRALFLSYPGQGMIYNIITKYAGFESAYVPVATYECSFDSEVDGCGQLDGVIAKVLVILMGIFGLFVCFFGHWFFKIQMLFFGFLSSALVSFVLLTRYTKLETMTRDELTIAIGVAGGILWVIFWVLVKIPVLSLLINAFTLGFLIISVVLFTPIGDEIMLRNDFNYWMLVLCGMLLVSIFVLPSSKWLSIISSAIIGSYVVIVLVDRNLGTMLSYIILNVVKRAVNETTSLAWNKFPFQRNDIILSSCWGCLALMGIIIQSRNPKWHTRFPGSSQRRRRRSDFERLPRTAPSSHATDAISESTPLLNPVSAGEGIRRYSSI